MSQPAVAVPRRSAALQRRVEASCSTTALRRRSSSPSSCSSASSPSASSRATSELCSPSPPAWSCELILGRIFLEKVAAPGQRLHHRHQRRHSAAFSGLLALRSVRALSITSKYALRFRGRHLWNPSNFGICAMLFLASDAVAGLSIQWGNNLASLIVIWMLGSLIVWRARRFHITAIYVVSFLALSFLRALDHRRSLAVGNLSDHRTHVSALHLFHDHRSKDHRPLAHRSVHRRLWPSPLWNSSCVSAAASTRRFTRCSGSDQPHSSSKCGSIRAAALSPFPPWPQARSPFDPSRG